MVVPFFRCHFGVAEVVARRACSCEAVSWRSVWKKPQTRLAASAVRSACLGSPKANHILDLGQWRNNQKRFSPQNQINIEHRNCELLMRPHRIQPSSFLLKWQIQSLGSCVQSAVTPGLSASQSRTVQSEERKNLKMVRIVTSGDECNFQMSDEASTIGYQSTSEGRESCEECAVWRSGGCLGQ